MAYTREYGGHGFSPLEIELMHEVSQLKSNPQVLDSRDREELKWAQWHQRRETIKAQELLKPIVAEHALEIREKNIEIQELKFKVNELERRLMRAPDTTLYHEKVTVTVTERTPYHFVAPEWFTRGETSPLRLVKKA